MNSKNRNYYAEAISSIEKIQNLKRDDLVKILFEIARTNPSALIRSFSKVIVAPQKSIAIQKRESTLSKIDREILIMGRSNKITAIKRFRELTGCGLKYSKDYVEKLLMENPQE